jgi:hypothetical protein
LASSEAQPVAIVLSFGLHEGSGCNCCNLAHQKTCFTPLLLKYLPWRISWALVGPSAPTRSSVLPRS